MREREWILARGKGTGVEGRSLSENSRSASTTILHSFFFGPQAGLSPSSLYISRLSFATAAQFLSPWQIQIELMLMPARLLLHLSSK